MKHLIYIIGLSLIISSCKKDKLEGEKDIFLGTWKWTETIHTFGLCEGDNFVETITPESSGNNYSMNFFENGIVKYYENDNYISKARIVFTGFGNNRTGSLSDYIRFEIALNNNFKDQSAYFSGCICESEMQVINGFPFDVYEKYCERYTSHFIKE